MSQSKQSPIDRASTEAWTHPVDLIEAEQKAALVGQLAEVLTPIMVYIAKGKASGTDRHRMWVWFYETRRDLYEGETIEEYAKRVGLSAPRIYKLIEEFREIVPAYHSAHRKRAATKARMSAAGKARWKAVKDGQEAGS